MIRLRYECKKIFLNLNLKIHEQFASFHPYVVNRFGVGVHSIWEVGVLEIQDLFY